LCPGNLSQGYLPIIGESPWEINIASNNFSFPFSQSVALSRLRRLKVAPHGTIAETRNLFSCFSFKFVILSSTHRLQHVANSQIFSVLFHRRLFIIANIARTHLENQR
jgi:hypothetical protein